MPNSAKTIWPKLRIGAAALVNSRDDDVRAEQNQQKDEFTYFLQLTLSDMLWSETYSAFPAATYCK